MAAFVVWQAVVKSPKKLDSQGTPPMMAATAMNLLIRKFNLSFIPGEEEDHVEEFKNH